jgi:hypothetical protein
MSVTPMDTDTLAFPAGQVDGVGGGEYELFVGAVLASLACVASGASRRKRKHHCLGAY